MSLITKGIDIYGREAEDMKIEMEKYISDATNLNKAGISKMCIFGTLKKASFTRIYSTRDDNDTQSKLNFSLTNHQDAW